MSDYYPIVREQESVKKKCIHDDKVVLKLLLCAQLCKKKMNTISFTFEMFVVNTICLCFFVCLKYNIFPANSSKMLT